jgi:hypothetical protein
VQGDVGFNSWSNIATNSNCVRGDGPGGDRINNFGDNSSEVNSDLDNNSIKVSGIDNNVMSNKLNGGTDNNNFSEYHLTEKDFSDGNPLRLERSPLKRRGHYEADE